MRHTISLMTVILAAALDPCGLFADDDELPVLVRENFEQGDGRWQPTDPQSWKLQKTDRGTIYHQHRKQSDYRPPHRSPFHISLLKDVVVGDFVLDTRVLSTHPDYGHRDVCLFFGYQDPTHFYYVHLGKKTDDHANQIFIVNDAPRTKISERTTPGTDWDDQWHHVRIRREAESGLIQIFFDNLEEPVMTATDTTFTWGQIGIGSFDDTSAWDNLVLRGERVER